GKVLARPPRRAGEPRDRPPAGLDEVTGVRLGALARTVRVVGFLVVVLPRDAVVLEPRVQPLARGRQVGPHVRELQVEADVAVEVAVPEVARIAFLGAPYLLRAVGISPEDRDARLAGDGRIDAVDGTGARVRDA